MKQLFLIFLALFLVNSSFGQKVSDEDNFHLLFRDQQAYWDRVLKKTSEEDLLKEEGSEYGNFLKWKTFYRERVPDNGDISVIYKELTKAFEDPEPLYIGSGQWRDVGPNDLPISSQLSKGVGPVNFLSFDPNFSTTQLMFTGCWSGGMYFSENAGDTWENGGLDKIDFGIGMADCRSSHLDENTWFAISGNGDGLFDNTKTNNIARGIYRTINKGQNWVKIGDISSFPFNGNIWRAQMKKILIDPRSTLNEFIVYITTSEGIFRTKNGLESNPDNIIWEKVFSITDAIDFDSSNPNTVFEKCWAYDIKWVPNSSSNPDGKIVATISKKSSFIPETGITNINCRVCDGNNQRFYTSIIYSDPVNSNQIGDQGSWQELQLPETPTSFTEETTYVRISLGITPNNNYNKLYVFAIGCNDVNKIYTYNWTTSIWDTSLTGVPGWNGPGQYCTAGIDISPVDEDLIYVTSSTHIEKSINGGQTFDQISSGGNRFHADVEDIKFNPSGDGLYLATHGGVYKSNAQATSWAGKSDGLSVAEVSSLACSYTNPELMSIGLFHDNSMISDGIYSDFWTPNWHSYSAGDGFKTAINYTNPNYVYASLQNSFARKYDFTTYINSVCPPTDETKKIGYSYYDIPFETHFELNYFNPKKLYFVRNHIWRNDNYGGTSTNDPDWVQISDFVSENNQDDYFAYNVFSSKTNSNVLFVHEIGDGHKLYITNKANESAALAQASWVEIPYPSGSTARWLTDIESDPLNPNVFYLITGQYTPGSSSYSKVVKYEYQGANLATDDLTQNTPSFITTDLTYNLPNITVSQIFINPGTPEYFIQTDLGVYYTNSFLIEDHISNSSSPAWFIYGDNIPNCIGTGLEPNYKSNQIRAGLFGRGVWEIDMPCEKLSQNFEIIEDTEFDKIMRFRQDIIVKAGAKLTIKETVYMTSNTKIIVEAGAILRIDGGTITSICGELWHGIVMLGDNQLPQTTSNQAKVEVYGVVENSKYGVTNIQGLGGSQETSSGGIINTFNAIFRNNKTDILYKDYQNINSSGLEVGNISSIKKTTFETTDDYIGISIDEHISFRNINGFIIKGNIFQDLRAEVNKLENGRIGINSYFSTFNLNEYCADTQQWPPPATCDGIRNEFIDLKYGIKAYGVNNPAHFSLQIKNSDFDCVYGVYLLAIPDADVFLNHFTQRKYHNIINGPITYGLYLNHCRNYHVEANNYVGISSLDSYIVGIVVRNRHGESTSIYRNSFNNLGVGVETIGENKSSTSLHGLVIRCNEFENSFTDIYVTEDSYNPNPSSIDGIAYYQGYPDSPTDAFAGNLFGTQSNIHIKNYNCDYFNYFHHNTVTTGSEQRVVPSQTSGSIGIFSGSYPYNSNSCPDGIITGGDVVIGFKSLAIEQLAVVTSTDTELEALVDGGNTPDLKQSVIFTNETNAIDNYDELMVQEGYLSEEVMDEVATKEIGLNQAMIRDVLVANPQAAKSKSVTEKLDARINPLPDYMRSQIQEGLAVMSPKESLELQKGCAKSKHDSLIHKGMHILLKDSTDRTDDLLTLLSNTNDIAFEYRKLEILEAQNRTLEADLLLTEMSNMSLSTKAQEDLQDYTDIRNLLRTWKQQSKNMNTLSETDLNSLSLYIDKQNKSAAKAMCLLAANNALEYTEPVYWPEEVEDRSFNTDKAFNSTLDVNSDWLKLYPNPAKDYVTVEYSFSSPEKPILLKIIDVLGKPVFSKILNYRHDQLLIDTRAFVKGSYWISIYAGSEKIKTQSLQIDK